jgi:S1-C subfamily serine protease
VNARAVQTLRAGWRTVSAEVVRVDAANDLALLKASNKQFSLSAEEFLDAPNKLRLNLRRCPLRRAAP